MNVDQPALLNYNCPKCNSVLFPLNQESDILSSLSTNEPSINKVKCLSCMTVYMFDDI